MPSARQLAIQREAWRLHRENGHPEGYDGPCWGPTQAEVEQARANLEERNP